MRRLMLLRHAKAAPPDGLKDLDRPLAKRGKAAAERMAAYLADEQLFPDLAVVSPARRTRETFAPVASKLGEVPVRFEPRLYEASAERLLAVAREAEPGVAGLLMIGHNPGFQELARMLVGYGDRYAFARMGQKYPTAALAVIDFDGEDWRGLKAGSGRLERFVTPASLGADGDD
jgi:phosphohistidine phosphatase